MEGLNGLTLTEVAARFDVSPAFIANRLTKRNVKIPTRVFGGKKVRVFSEEEIRKLEKLGFFNRVAIKRTAEKSVEKIADNEQLYKEHPLVKDPRFFKDSFFPDTEPICFSEE